MDDKGIILEVMRQQGATDAVALSARAASGEADGTELIEKQHSIPTWREKDYSKVPVGTPYQWQGQVYKLWQQHNATGQSDWSPDKAVSLWDAAHTTDPEKAKPYVGPQGSRGLYQKGECMIWTDEKVYRSLIDNNAYTPDVRPQDWEVVA